MIDIQELIREIDELDSDFQALIDKHVEAIGELEGEVKERSKEAGKLRGQAKVMKQKIQDLRDGLLKILDSIGSEVVHTSDGRSVRKMVTGVPPVIINDGVEPEDVPPRYQSISVSFDLVKIRKDLEAGHEEPARFAKLGEREPSIQIK